MAQSNVVGGVIQSCSPCIVEPGAGLANPGPFEQKAWALHVDAEAFNLFTGGCQISRGDGYKTKTSFAVQIGTYAIPLTRPSFVIIQKGLLNIDYYPRHECLSNSNFYHFRYSLQVC